MSPMNFKNSGGLNEDFDNKRLNEDFDNKRLDDKRLNEELDDCINEEVNKQTNNEQTTNNQTANALKLKNQFLNCVEDDNNSNRLSKPATKKLDNLDLFISTLLNKKYQEILLDENILQVVKMWLEPLPDHTLPNITIRKKLLEVLKVLNVDKNHLLESGIGKIIHFYSLNPKENLEIKRMALEIIQKWTRRVFKDE